MNHPAALGEGREGFKKAVAFVALCLLGLIAASLFVGCRATCATGAICGDGNIVGVSPLPSPSVVPSPGATPDPCRYESIQVGFHSGGQVPFVSLGAVEQLDATPYNSSGPVPDGCNQTRTVTWSVLTPTTCQVIGTGYTPFLRGLKVGGCTITATMGNVSAPFSVEVR